MRGNEALILTKYIALEGTALLAKEKEEELAGYFYPGMVRQAAAFAALLDTAAEEKIASEAGAAAVLRLGSGGLKKTLWELSETCKIGLSVDWKAVPVRQESIEICEYFGLDPYALRSRGALLIVAEEERKILSALKSAGIPARTIGSLSGGNDRVLVCGERISYLNRPSPDDGIEKLLWPDDNACCRER